MERSWVWVLSVMTGSFFGSNSGVWINARVASFLPFSFHIFLLPVWYGVGSISFTSNLFSSPHPVSSFLHHVRVTIFDVSWCHVRQSRKIMIATIECKMISNTKITVYEYWVLARASYTTLSCRQSIKLAYYACNPGNICVFHFQRLWFIGWTGMNHTSHEPLLIRLMTGSSKLFLGIWETMFLHCAGLPAAGRLHYKVYMSRNDQGFLSEQLQTTTRDFTYII